MVAEGILVGAADAGLGLVTAAIEAGRGLCWMMKFCQSATQTAPSGPTSA